MIFLFLSLFLHNETLNLIKRKVVEICGNDMQAHTRLGSCARDASPVVVGRPLMHPLLPTLHLFILPPTAPSPMASSRPTPLPFCGCYGGHSWLCCVGYLEGVSVSAGCHYRGVAPYFGSVIPPCIKRLLLWSLL